MTLPIKLCTTTERNIAARNALIAKYTLETLGEDQRQRVDERIADLLILSGINVSRAPRYRSQLRETQYCGMAAIAMAFLGIRPALMGILSLERWEYVKNPLVALTGAHHEIQLASNEIMRKHGVMVSISDEDKAGLKREYLTPEIRKPGDISY